MQKEVRFGGLATNPSDYDAADGQLSASLGLVNEDGAMRPVWQPEAVGASLGDRKVMYLHANNGYRHYIVAEQATEGARERNTLLMWISEEYLLGDYSQQQVIEHLVTITVSIGEVLTVSSVGNTLVVISSTGMHYILWKNDAYKYIGKQPPEMQIQFGVSGTYAANYPGLFNPNAHNGAGYAAHCGASIEEMYAMISETNAIVTRANHFYAPFVVRYCYRLFDGSMIMHSAPVFIPITAPYSYFVENMTVFIDTDGQPHGFDLTSINDSFREQGESTIITIGHAYTLRYQPNNVALSYRAWCLELATLKQDWKDIVKTVDIFITPPIIRERMEQNATSSSIQVLKYHYYNYTLDVRQLKLSVPQDYEGLWNPTRYLTVDFPQYTEAEYCNMIKNASTFYKIASFDISNDEILADYHWHDVPINSGVLSTLTSQEVMVDDYRTHNTLTPHYNANNISYASLFTYNNRLNVSGVDDKLFGGFDIRTMVPYDDRVDNSGHGTIIKVIKELVYIQTEEGEKIVTRDFGSGINIWQAALKNQPLFYPDRRANRMLLYCKVMENNTWVYKWYGFILTESPMLNGAYSEGGIYSDLSTAEGHNVLVEVEAPGTISEGSNIENTDKKIYTSEVENPFYFPALSINTMPAGVILATVAATKPLSQGQFGQFPLYAFTTEGVWALEVAADGTYETIKPVTRDVCTNLDSITQLDNAVLFVSNRGIMLLQGSDTACITDGILDDDAFDISTLPHIKDSNIRPNLKNMTMSHAFLAGCRMLYDYQNQHIVVFNPEERFTPRGTESVYPYAYVFSLKSKTWGMMENNLASTLNSYPEALAIDKRGYVVSFAGTTQEHVQGLLVTRPLKLGAPDIYKTIHTMKQNGMFQKGHVKTLLYASRDQHKWYLIASSVDEWIRGLRGTPWRWFRIALLTDLSKGESVSGAMVEFEAKETGKMH